MVTLIRSDWRGLSERINRVLPVGISGLLMGWRHSDPVVGGVGVGRRLITDWYAGEHGWPIPSTLSHSAP